MMERSRAVPMLARACAAAALLGACNTPTPSLRIGLAGGPNQMCPSTDCNQVRMACDTVMSIRIIDPKDPSFRGLRQCVPVPLNKMETMCAMNRIDLDSTPLPVRELEVQIALYAATDIPADPADPQHLLCPEVQFNDSDGFPKEQAPAPALGGRAYYHPGDSTVSVTLGCTNLGAINASCVDTTSVAVSATVSDFESGFPVVGRPSQQLRVAVGEPLQGDSGYLIGPAYTQALRLTSEPSTDAIATWGSDVTLPLRQYACVEVQEDSPMTTATLRCYPVGERMPLDLSGSWLRTDLLDKVLRALGSGFPDGGLTVGMVVDGASQAVAGATVSADNGDVKYLAKSNNGLAMGATTTSDTGIFLSVNANFGTRFSASLGDRTATAIGGIVDNRVTIVILSLSDPP